MLFIKNLKSTSQLNVYRSKRSLPNLLHPEKRKLNHVQIKVRILRFGFLFSTKKLPKKDEEVDE